MRVGSTYCAYVNGTVRICGDYKVTVTRYAHVEHYPLPTPENVFATLASQA